MNEKLSKEMKRTAIDYYKLGGLDIVESLVTVLTSSEIESINIDDMLQLLLHAKTNHIMESINAEKLLLGNKSDEGTDNGIIH